MLFKDVVPCTSVTRLIAWDVVLSTPSVFHVWVRGRFRPRGQAVRASSSSDTPSGIGALPAVEGKGMRCAMQAVSSPAAQSWSPQPPQIVHQLL